MNPSNKGPEEEALSHVLQSWRVEASLPPGFRGAVWTRIAAAEASGWRALWQHLLVRLETAWRKPALATAYLALVCFLGVTAGYLHGRQAANQIQSNLGRAYLQQVDPYQAPRS